MQCRQTDSLNREPAVRSVPIPLKLTPVLAARIAGQSRGVPAISSPRGSRLSRENWARAVRFKEQTRLLGQPATRIHDLRHTLSSLARSAGADLKLLQQTMGHASVTVTAHTYADLFDGDLDRVADALDSLTDAPHNAEPALGRLLAVSEGDLTIKNRAVQQ